MLFSCSTFLRLPFLVTGNVQSDGKYYSRRATRPDVLCTAHYPLSSDGRTNAVKSARMAGLLLVWL